MVIDRLVDEAEDGMDAVVTAIQRRGQSPMCADAADREQSRPVAPVCFGEDPFELADLVSAPTPVAESALVLEPDFAGEAEVVEAAYGGGTVPSRACPSDSASSGKRWCRYGGTVVSASA